jgi:DNA invertase Pin-like site-specific DNA recombinase
MRAALYARVSTADKGQDPTLQTSELESYCSARGLIVEGEYVDAGVSGSKESRPQLNRLMSDARRRKFDVVVVWKLDRFGRSLKHLLNTLAEFEALGIAFVSLRDSLDLSTPSGRLMFQVIGAMAEFERALLRERVRAGIAHARSKGRKFGRPKVTVEAGRISSLRSEGLTIRQIATALGVSRSLVHKALSNSASVAHAVSVS